MPDISLETEAIRAQGRRWKGFADRLTPVRTTVEGLSLDESAFFVGELTGGAYARAYADFWISMVGLLREAEIEFDLISTVLKGVADSYDEVDATTTRDLNKLYSVTPDQVAEVTGDQQYGFHRGGGTAPLSD